MRSFLASWWRPAVLIFLSTVVIRGLTGYFVATHFADPGWFPSGIFDTFNNQAVGVLDGTKPAFWIIDPSDPTSAIYPPGYSLWLVIVYAVSGVSREGTGPVLHLVQLFQLVMDSASVFLMTAIGANAFGRTAGIAAGFAAGLSPLLALYGATPLADAPTSWIVLGAIVCLVLAYNRQSIPFGILSGALLGLSCWFRANGLLLAVICGIALIVLLRDTLSQRLRLAFSLILATAIVIAPVMLRNSIAFHAFVPTGLGVGTNLWEGIGETDRAGEFGAVYGDRQLTERERLEQGLGDDPRVSLYWPDGVTRDRARAKKALSIIASHPIWYSTVMAKRMWGMLKYAGEDSGIYGSTGVNVTPAKSLPEGWRFIPVSTLVTILGWMQSVFRYVALPLMLIGLVLSFRVDCRITLLLTAPIVYYLVFGSLLHSEIRYSLPMQAILMVFAGVGASSLLALLHKTPLET